MKSVLLGKHHDITAFASKDPARYVINSVHYHAEKKVVEAVNGHVAIRIPVVESEDFPPVKGQLEAPPVDCVIPVETFKRGLANAAKGTSRIPVLNYTKLDCNGSVSLTATDMDNEVQVTSRPVEGVFPNVDQVMPEWQPALTIALSANVLKPIVEYALKHSSDQNSTIRFGFKDSTSAFLFSINVEDLNGPNKATGVGMSVRIS